MSAPLCRYTRRCPARMWPVFRRPRLGRGMSALHPVEAALARSGLRRARRAVRRP